MESYEASRAVFTRVQNIDPENASKIMGYILLHHGEKDVIHLAYGPETLIFSLVNRAKTDLGLSSNTSSAPHPPPPVPVVSPISNPISISRPNPLSLSSPRLSNGFNPSSPSSPSIWSPHHISLSPSNVNHTLPSSYSAASSVGKDNMGLLDDYHFQRDPLFLSDPVIGEPGLDLWCGESNNNSNSSSSGETNGNNNSNSNFHHRRSQSFNDSNLSYFGTDDSTSGFGFKPCLYYSRGFCKNGSSCNFVHGGSCGGGGAGAGAGGGFLDDNCGPIGAVAAFEQCQEDMIRSKLVHQHRLAAQLMASGVSLPYNKLGFLHSEAQRSAAALMMSEDFHKLNRVRMARNEFAGMMDCNPGSRQIYLTFPADSTFKEEDVSNYFNKFGPVQDVRIPYQQKRMFGFVTFVFPETVKIILAKGNPHFVCESRVLVKPYKEKGKLPDKKQHQHQFDRGEYSCSSPSGHDCREPYDVPLGGGRMLYSTTQEMLLRKKLEEQADFQHALELQERRLMNLQLLDLKNPQHQQTGSPIMSPNLSSQLSTKQSPFSPSNGIGQDPPEENTASVTGADDDENTGLVDINGNVPKKEVSSPNREENELFQSFEHVLPDNLFASPTKLSSDIRPAAFSPALAEPDNGAAAPNASSTSTNDSALPATSSLNMSPLKSCFFEMPRISTGHGALGM